MHRIQRLILDLAKTEDLSQMGLSEIGRKIGDPHPHAQKIKHHLLQLRRKGLLTSDSKLVSTLTEDNNSRNLPLRSIPILGAANCGEAELFADESLEGFLQVSPSMVPRKKGLFAIRAVGNSMDRADVDGKRIEEGDFVIIDPTCTRPRNGEYILSIISGQANIKKYIHDTENDHVILVSESSSEYPPIYIHPRDLEHYRFNGKVILVIKKPLYPKAQV